MPLRARGRTVGALACGVGTSGRSYDEADLRFAEVLSGVSRSRSTTPGCRQTVSGLEQRLEATLTNLAEAVLVRDADGAIVFANAAAARLLAWARSEEVTAAAPEELMALFDVFDEARPRARAGRPAVVARGSRRARPSRCWSAT